MLAEALLYARARLSGQGNPHGHLTELVGIWARHRRQRHAWAGHLARARACCLKAAQQAPGRRTALVLGAGLLLDVPLERLSELYGRVVLADLAFLPGTIRLAKRLGNVELRTADLTACMHALPDAGELAARAPAPQPDLSLGERDVDFAYSANLLSQAPLYALHALRKRRPAPREADLEAFGASLVRAHLLALCALPCPACLLTDTRELGLRPDPAGGKPTPVHEADLLHGAWPDLPGETWTWRLAPGGEAEPGLDIERAVCCVEDVRAAMAGAGGLERAGEGGGGNG